MTQNIISFSQSYSLASYTTTERLGLPKRRIFTICMHIRTTLKSIQYTSRSFLRLLLSLPALITIYWKVSCDNGKWESKPVNNSLTPRSFRVSHQVHGFDICLMSLQGLSLRRFCKVEKRQFIEGADTTDLELLLVNALAGWALSIPRLGNN